MKMVIIIRKIDGEAQIEESISDFTVDVPEADTKNLVPRLRLLMRRELIRRGIIAPEPEDNARQR